MSILSKKTSCNYSVYIFQPLNKYFCLWIEVMLLSYYLSHITASSFDCLNTRMINHSCILNINRKFLDIKSIFVYFHRQNQIQCIKICEKNKSSNKLTIYLPKICFQHFVFLELWTHPFECTSEQSCITWS